MSDLIPIWECCCMSVHPQTLRVQPKTTLLLEESKWVEYKFTTPIVSQQFTLQVPSRLASVSIRTVFIKRPPGQDNSSATIDGHDRVEVVHFCLEDLINEAYRHPCAPAYQAMFKNRLRIVGNKLDALSRKYSGVAGVTPLVSRFKFGAPSDLPTDQSDSVKIRAVDLMGAVVCLLSIGDPSFDVHFCQWLSGICRALLVSVRDWLGLDHTGLCGLFRTAMCICFGSDDLQGEDFDSACDNCKKLDQPWTFVFCQGLRLIHRMADCKSCLEFESIRCTRIYHLCAPACFPDLDFQQITERAFVEMMPMFCDDCMGAMNVSTELESTSVASKCRLFVWRLIQHPWCVYLVDMEPESCFHEASSKLKRENWIDLLVVAAKCSAGQIVSSSCLHKQLICVLDHADVFYPAESLAHTYNTLIRVSFDKVWSLEFG
eukprot:TRINITY_DN28735_c0_g1_i1.p1 TRINITY_DN28735_c0_g1~~TRINITY_DN28735_c0_g1_i1.p1  ORF type:complete len:431 (-),score=83.55 TRINITY_DN28735_c0_g1_i1:25-1317(-)